MRGQHPGADDLHDGGLVIVSTIAPSTRRSLAYTQMLDRVSTLARISNASVIADADTGYGGLLNVHHTVRGYEDAGVVGIQIEDQEFPKKCGHTPFKRVVPLIDMVEKVKVACEARRNHEETLTIARTDARQTDGFEGALKRAIAYGEAGADIVFVEALESEDEMRIACGRIAKPMMANMADGGKTPIRSKFELETIGYKLAIFPSMTGLAAAAAAENALRVLQTEGTSNSPKVPLFDFSEFNTLIGFEEVWAFERRWARPGDKMGT
jgi:2-methylisocitrate lyase-like PEP mutase family enzyme